MKSRTPVGRNSAKIILVGVGIALIGILGALLGFQTISTGGSGDPTVRNPDIDTKDDTASSVGELSLSNLISGGSPLRGDPTAPVTIVEFGDFQCPNCARFAINTEPELEKEYFNTGKANMVFKHVPVRGPDSVTAAIAAQCAGDQGKFWEFHDLLYHNQKGENSDWASVDSMKQFALDLGLDINMFNPCLESKKYESLVQNDFAFARNIGVTGTPTFVVVNSNGSEPVGIIGAQPFNSFRAVIEQKTETGQS